MTVRAAGVSARAYARREVDRELREQERLYQRLERATLERVISENERWEELLESALARAYAAETLLEQGRELLPALRRRDELVLERSKVNEIYRLRDELDNALRAYRLRDGMPLARKNVELAQENRSLRELNEQLSYENAVLRGVYANKETR